MSEPTLLLIECSPKRREHLLRALKDVPAHRLAADTAKRALRCVGDRRIDLLIATVDSSDMSPLVALAHLRDLPNVRDAALMMISSAFGSKRDALMRNLKPLRVTKWMPDPMTEEEYKKYVAILLEEQRQRAEEAAETAASAPEEEMAIEAARPDTGLLEATLRQRLLDYAARIGEVDHFERLSVGRRDDTPVIREALVQALRRYHPTTAPQGDTELQEALSRIQAALRESFEVLTDPYRRMCFLRGRDESTINASTRPILDLKPPTKADDRDSGMLDVWKQDDAQRTRAEGLAESAHMNAVAGDFGGAATMIQQALAIDPQEPSWRYRLQLYRGMDHRKQGRLDEARACLKRAARLALNPENNAAQRALEKLEQRAAATTKQRSRFPRLGRK